MSGGKLFVVPTPIGNLGDMTPRALDVLRSVQFVLAEDTRTTGKLLRHFGIDRPLKSFHQHNEHRSVEGWVEAMMAGAQLALCSDAGTPGNLRSGILAGPRMCRLKHCRRMSPWCDSLCASIGDLRVALRSVLFRRIPTSQKGKTKRGWPPCSRCLAPWCFTKAHIGSKIAYPTCRTRCRKATHRGEPRNFKTSRRNPSWHNFRCSRCPLTT